MRNAPKQEPTGPEIPSKIQASQQLLQAGMSPLRVAEMVFEAILQDKFYILTDPDIKQGVQLRMDDILQERSPRDTYELARQHLL